MILFCLLLFSLWSTFFFLSLCIAIFLLAMRDLDEVISSFIQKKWQLATPHLKSESIEHSFAIICWPFLLYMLWIEAFVFFFFLFICCKMLRGTVARYVRILLNRGTSLWWPTSKIEHTSESVSFLLMREDLILHPVKNTQIRPSKFQLNSQVLQHELHLT
jgi:hypothetical protein